MVFKSIIGTTCACLAVVSFNVNAAVTYQYAGNDYTNFYAAPSIYDTSMSINGSFTVDSKLISANGDISDQVTSYDFSDGVNTYSNTDPEGLSQFIVNTDSDGNITNWIIDIFDVSSLSPTVQPGDIISRIISQPDLDQADLTQCDFIVVTCVFSQIDGATIFNNQGSWSVVPVPAAAWLFGSGLIALIGLARRKGNA